MRKADIRWLSKRRALLQEIEDLQVEMAALALPEAIRNDRVQVQSASDSTLDDIVIKRSELAEKIQKKCSQAIDEYNRIEDYLCTVEDPEARVILRLRFVQGQTLSQIGEALHMDRRTVSRKIESYVKR